MSNDFDRNRTSSKPGQQDDSGAAANDSGGREESASGRRSTVANTLFSIFSDIGAASESSGEERAQHIERARTRLGKDAALKDRFLAFVGQLDEEDEDPMVAAIHEHLMGAADPYTGVVPDDFRMEPALQAYYDQSEELQAYRQSLPELLGNRPVSRYARERLARRQKPAEVSSWFVPSWAPHMAAQSQPQWIARSDTDPTQNGGADERAMRESETRGEIPGTDWMLERRLIGLMNQDRLRVEFRLVRPLERGDDYAHHDQWGVQLLDGDTELATMKSKYDDEVWELKGTFSEEQIALHRVIVVTVPGESA